VILEQPPSDRFTIKRFERQST